MITESINKYRTTTKVVVMNREIAQYLLNPTINSLYTINDIYNMIKEKNYPWVTAILANSIK